MKKFTNEFGNYYIEDKVFEEIAENTCLNIDGINPAKNDKNFCKVKSLDDKDILTISIRIKKGIDIDSICNKIQEDISESIKLMTGIEFNNINIDIQGFIQ